MKRKYEELYLKKFKMMIEGSTKKVQSSANIKTTATTAATTAATTVATAAPAVASSTGTAIKIKTPSSTAAIVKPSPNKQKPQPQVQPQLNKVQSLPIKQLESMGKIHLAILNDPQSFAFKYPVDTKMYPDYIKRIKIPMDLSLIKVKSMSKKF